MVGSLAQSGQAGRPLCGDDIEVKTPPEEGEGTRHVKGGAQLGMAEKSAEPLQGEEEREPQKLVQRSGGIREGTLPHAKHRGRP